MSSVVDKILVGKKYIGIEFFSVDNTQNIICIHATKKNNEILLTKTETYGKIEELVSDNKNIPAILILNTGHVLHKEVTSTDINDRKLLHKAYPNLNIDDFYYEIWRKSESSIIAICRKEYVNQLIASLNDKITIAGISLGILTLSTVVQFIDEDSIKTNCYTVQISATENSLLKSQNNLAEFYSLNGLNVQVCQLLAFSGILALLVTKGYTSGNIIELNKTLKENFIQKTFFSKGLRVIIILLLALLFLNFLLFSYYYKKATESEETLSFNRISTENLIKLKNRVKEQEEKAAIIISNSAFKSSVVLNEIAGTVPSSILLTEINYHPLQKKLKHEEAIISSDDIIIISGSATDNQGFTLWLENLEKLKWIQNVTILSFGNNENINTDFSIQITTKNDA